MLPLLLEDHVQAREDGLRVLGVVRVLACRGQLVGGDGGEEVAHHRDAARAGLEHLGVRRCDRREDRHVRGRRPRCRRPQAEGVERLLDLQDRPAQPRVRGQDQVPQRLRERPLAGHRDVDRAGRHRRDALERGRPGALERGPGRAQAVRILGAPVGAAGEAAVELGLDERGHVDAVDAQEALAVGRATVRRCPPRAPRRRASRRRTGRPDEPGAAQVRVDELRSLQVVGPGEGCHDFSLSWWLGTSYEVVAMATTTYDVPGTATTAG